MVRRLLPILFIGMLLVELAAAYPVWGSAITTEEGRAGDHVWFLASVEHPRLGVVYALHTASAVRRYMADAKRLASELDAAVLIYGQDTTEDRNRLLWEGLGHVAYDNEPGDGTDGNFLWHLVEVKRAMVSLLAERYPGIPIALVGTSKESYAGYFLLDDERVRYFVLGMFKAQDMWQTALEAQAEWGCTGADRYALNPEDTIPMLVMTELKGVMGYVDPKSYLEGVGVRDDATLWIFSQLGTPAQHDGRYFPLGVAEGGFVGWLAGRGWHVCYSFGVSGSGFAYRVILPRLAGNNLPNPCLLMVPVVLEDGVIRPVASDELTMHVGTAEGGRWNAPNVRWIRVSASNGVRFEDIPTAVYLSDDGFQITGTVALFGGTGKVCYRWVRAVLMWVGSGDYRVSYYRYPAEHGVYTARIDVSPVIAHGRTLVPVRFVAEALGGSVSWDSDERRVDISLDGKNVSMWIGRREYTVDGQLYRMDVAPVILNGRTIVPIRFLTEALGGEVWWYPQSRSVAVMLRGR